jgi:DUF971 family protein
LSDDGRALLLGWQQGRLDAALLWAECPSARQRRRRLEGDALNPPHGLAIVRVTPVGRYAVNIAFSDGHDRGIYPWSLLEELARRRRVEDFITREDFIMSAPADAARGLCPHGS